MSALKKNQKEPSLVGVLISALAMVLLGVVGGFFYLASFPAKSFSAAADREAFLEERGERAAMPGDVFYMKGPTRRTKTWQQKRSQIINNEGGTVELSAGELNAWISNRFQTARVSESDQEAGILMIPSLPNFYIGEGQLTLSLRVDASFYGNDADFVLLAKGAFDEGPKPKFRFSGFSINSAAIPVQAGIAKQVIAVFLKAYKGSDEYATLRDAWARVESAEVAGGNLRISFR